jgi:hypothetical protein
MSKHQTIFRDSLGPGHTLPNQSMASHKSVAVIKSTTAIKNMVEKYEAKF